MADPGSGSTAERTAAEDGRRPNFLVIVADQLRADAVGAFARTDAADADGHGGPVGSSGFADAGLARTPNLDALAQRGTRFTNAFVQHTVCSPSRASFLTGWYPHTRGHRTLTHLLRPEDPNLLKTLKQHGYHVTHVGPRGDTWAPGATEASCDEYGWAEPPASTIRDDRVPGDLDDPMARAFYTGLRPPDDPDRDHDFDEACTRTVESWLATRTGPGATPGDGQPWMLYVPLFFPHCPFVVGEPWFSLHDRDTIPTRRPPVQSGHEPAFAQHLRDLYGTDRLTDQQWREIAAVYHGMVSRMDHHVGRMVDALGGLAAETIVVFLSDHGEYLGDYDLIEKWPSGLHDCLARDPLLLAGPDIPEGNTVDDPVELIDLVPTVHELAGVTDPGYTHFGRSLLPVLRDPAIVHRTHAFTEGGFLVEEAHLLERPDFPYDLKGRAQWDRPETVGKAVAVRTREWTYVWRLYESAELYHRIDDPDEVHNLAGLPQHASIERALRDEIMRWQMATADVIPWEPDPRFPRIDLPKPSPESR
ncbi:MAG: sulfatase-like hydrolase/transferase [Actinomycetota bacterium]